MPSFAPVDITQAWTPVITGPFIGRVSVLTGGIVALTVAM